MWDNRIPLTAFLTLLEGFFYDSISMLFLIVMVLEWYWRIEYQVSNAAVHSAVVWISEVQVFSATFGDRCLLNFSGKGTH